ncbi:hypothetical protein [Rhizobium alvei]|uniref:Transmembrane protein n=1 Tax=Rhizobium alvei TaxID=1132659 RepID=A0ABT8YPD5_9HYPH|nr:hypothetical protein [Rhizobium alvei]MDO6965538.1 hypothetical protein [Rhizobium alvei]
MAVNDATLITTRGRIYLSIVMVLIALVMGFAASGILYKVAGNSLRSSTAMGRILCGEGQKIDHTTGSNGKGIRMVCLDATGTEVGPRNNLIAVKLALPFFILIAVPGLWFAWTAKLYGRRVKR